MTSLAFIQTAETSPRHFARAQVPVSRTLRATEVLPATDVLHFTPEEMPSGFTGRFNCSIRAAETIPGTEGLEFNLGELLCGVGGRLDCTVSSAEFSSSALASLEDWVQAASRLMVTSLADTGKMKPRPSWATFDPIKFVEPDEFQRIVERCRTASEPTSALLRALASREG